MGPPHSVTPVAQVDVHLSVLFTISEGEGGMEMKEKQIMLDVFEVTSQPRDVVSGRDSSRIYSSQILVAGNRTNKTASLLFWGECDFATGCKLAQKI